VLIELEKELKQEIAELRKEVREMKEQWKTRVEDLEKRMDAMENKIKETERIIIDRHEEKEEERQARISKLGTERIGRTETVKRPQKEEREREEAKIEINKLKRKIEDRERRERKNNLVIKGLKGKGKKNLIENAQKFLKEEFEVREGVKEMQIAGGEGREVVIIRMDSWERKKEIMRKKKKLGSRQIYIDNYLTQEEREMQRKLRVVARGERTKGRRTRVGYRRIEIKGQLYIWNEEENRIVKKRNF